MKDKIEALKQTFEEKISQLKSTEDLEQVRLEFLGKKGHITSLMSELKVADRDQKPLLGALINNLKQHVAAALQKQENDLGSKELEAQIKGETLDVTLPGRPRPQGSAHLLTSVMQTMIDICIEMGFSVQLGPEVETDYYNFQALNFPDNHPARDMQDTFYLAPNILLRTHSSNSQVHTMQKTKPPIRIVSPGRVYRNEEITSRSHVMFHQLEGLYIAEDVTLSNLLGTMDLFFKKLFKKDVKTRYRPSFFPFVEPGIEVDVECLSCGGSGCPLCKKTGWLEVAGAGMVHPNVLKESNIDPEKYSGYAWGLGLERIVMLLYGINDIRLFTDNDMRFSRQFIHNA